ncbi:paraquat-inducible protein A [Haloferula chungangensis]|uniref:Paraquat-inducible protein A n=1 Tax=Haloferula chungangensis TaxID=1048331 RepID=A0ABW2L6S6_9BACT
MQRKRHHPGLAWPRLDPNDRVACHLCDALQTAPSLPEGDAALCGNCGEVLFQNRPRSLSRATGFCTAALIFMCLVHSFPFLTMEAAGNHTELGLMQASRVLVKDGYLILSALTVFFTILAPIILTGGLLYLAAPLSYGKVLPGSIQLARLIQHSEPWSMLEVFLLGFLVSLLKLGHVAELHFGIGLWALVALVLCIAGAMGGIDRRELWDRLELAVHNKHEQEVPNSEAAQQE